jgi:hypothetical protein
MDAGELLQYGPTAEVFHAPQSLRVARAFSDPPMNLLPARPRPAGCSCTGGPALAMAAARERRGRVTVGLRASACVTPGAGDVGLAGQVELAEISGSDTFVHVDTPVGELVAQLTGVHRFELGTSITLYFNARRKPMCSMRPSWRSRLLAQRKRPHVHVHHCVRSLPSKGERDMARIDLDLAHAYRPNPTQDSDYALLPLKMSFATAAPMRCSGLRAAARRRC